jgi:Permease for cytosine/purines, uracil, thiamine, allantoin
MEDTTPSSNSYEKDVEAGVKEKTTFDGQDGLRHGSVVPEGEVIAARKIQHSFAPFRLLNKGEAWLDEKMGVETQGIDRIPEEEKQPPSIWNIFLIWFSMTLHVGTLPIGFLGPEFGLTLNQSVAAIVIGTFLGALCTGYCGTLGPKVSAIHR